MIMWIDVFNEISEPRAREEDHEHRRLMEAIGQVRLAEGLDYGAGGRSSKRVRWRRR